MSRLKVIKNHLFIVCVVLMCVYVHSMHGRTRSLGKGWDYLLRKQSLLYYHSHYVRMDKYYIYYIFVLYILLYIPIRIIT